MPIRTRPTVNVKPIQDEIDILNTFSEIVIEAGEATRAVIEPLFLDEARFYPARKNIKFRFQTERSRRWWFAAVNGKIPGVSIRTDGKRYLRSGKLAESYYVRAVITNDTFELVFGSDSTVSKWVVGSFDRNRDYQVRGHKDTGWIPIAQTADYWMDVAEDEFLERIPQIYAQWDTRRQNR